MQDDPSLPYGKVKSVEELGNLMRSHRKLKKITLQKVSNLSLLNMRFLSEIERGKKTAEIGKVLNYLHMLGLEVSIMPKTI